VSELSRLAKLVAPNGEARGYFGAITHQVVSSRPNISGARHVLLSQEDSAIETQSRSRERRFQCRIPTRFGSGTSPRATLRAALPS